MRMSWKTAAACFGLGLCVPVAGCAPQQAMSAGGPGYYAQSGLRSRASTPSGYLREMRAQQRREGMEAARRARIPQPVPAAHAGELAPVEGLAGLVAGKTLRLQTPIVQNGAHLRTDVEPIYLASNGQSYSRTWSGAPWQANGSELCIQNGNRPSCMTALSDSTGQAFVRKADGLLVQASVHSGDSDGVRAAYAQAQENRKRQDAMLGQVLNFVAKGMAEEMMGGGGGGGGSSRSTTDDMLIRQQERDRERRESMREPEPMPAPRTGGLYGNCHANDC